MDLPMSGKDMSTPDSLPIQQNQPIETFDSNNECYSWSKIVARASQSQSFTPHTSPKKRFEREKSMKDQAMLPEVIHADPNESQDAKEYEGEFFQSKAMKIKSIHSRGKLEVKKYLLGVLVLLAQLRGVAGTYVENVEVHNCQYVNLSANGHENEIAEWTYFSSSQHDLIIFFNNTKFPRKNCSMDFAANHDLHISCARGCHSGLYQYTVYGPVLRVVKFQLFVKGTEKPDGLVKGDSGNLTTATPNVLATVSWNEEVKTNGIFISIIISVAIGVAIIVAFCIYLIVQKRKRNDNSKDDGEKATFRTNGDSDSRATEE